MDFIGQARPLRSKDIELIAGYLGCEVAVVRAVLEVEARGEGFDELDRPKMLFEPHIFYRELKSGPVLERAKELGLAYPKQGEKPYPSDSYPRLLQAMDLNDIAALRSASWGMHQGMGFNHEVMGFKTVHEYVTTMMYSESAHLYAMGRFIVGNGLQRHLRSKDWSSFAKGYNGSDYAKHGYHTKLKAAYDARPQTERYVPPPTSAAELEAMRDVPPESPGVPPTQPPVEPPRYEIPKDKALGPMVVVAMTILAMAAVVIAWLVWAN